MTREPGEESLLSKILIASVVIILLLVMGSCVFFIYNYLQPSGSPVATATPTPTASAAPTTQFPSVTATPTPTAQASTGANVTVNPDESGVYEQDTDVTAYDTQYTSPQFSDIGIWNNYIVYDMLDGNGVNYSMLYNVNNQQTNMVDSGTVFSDGAIADGKLVLYYPLNGNKIYLDNIQTGEHDLTSMNDNSPRNSITMSDTKLAYYEDIGQTNAAGVFVHDYSIYVFDLASGQTASVIDNIPKPLDINMYDNELVYTVQDSNGQGSDVYYLDLSVQNPTPKMISVHAGDNNNARIYGNWVVYYSDWDGSNHIYLYNIQTGQTTEPAPNSQQQSADIYGTTVVYDDNRYGNWDIFSYDVNTHQETQLTNEPHDQEHPVIYGNQVAYFDDRGGNNDWQIYTMTLPSS